MNLEAVRKKTNKKLADLELARAQCRQEATASRKANEQIESIQEAQQLTQQVAQGIQQRAHDQIAGVVTRSLTAVFDEPYTFQIHFDRKRERTEARLVFEKDGLEVDPMTAAGGGVVDVAAFALRLSCLMLSKPPLRRILILDEPFKYVSERRGYRERVRQLLESLAEEMGIQILMVTHIEALQTGDIVELS